MAQKQLYNAPQIECIQIDNEISLTLDSTPPIPPEESMNKSEYNDNNPFKA
jgi:hypothetical protein